MKRPKDMTMDELDALPVGPIEQKFIPHTEAELDAGALGRGRLVPIVRERKAQAYDPSDLLYFVASNGSAYTFGQWADGQWFKRPA